MTVGFISLLVIVFKILFLDKYIRHRTYSVTMDKPLVDNVGLYKIQGVGFGFIGVFRPYHGTHATYRFFSLFWLPLFPLNCFRVRVTGVTSTETELDDTDKFIEGILGLNYEEPNEDYDIYSYENWDFLEILSIYLGRYAYTVMAVCVLIGIIKIIN